MNRILRIFKNRRVAVIAATIAVLILMNLVACLLPFRIAYPDVSGSTTYRLSDSSLRYLASIEQDVEMIYRCSGGVSNADKDLYPFVLQFADASPHITVKVEDTDQVTDAANQSIEIRSARRSRIISGSDLFYYYNTTTGMTLSLAEYSQILQMLSDLDSSEAYQSMLSVYGPSTMTAYFSGDANLTGAVRYVLADRTPVIYTFSKGSSDINQLLRQQLEQGGYAIQKLTSLESVPEDCEALYLNINADLSEAEAAVFSAYLENGGKAFLTTTYNVPEIPVLSAVLSEYGLSAPDTENMIYDSSSQMFYAVTGDHPVTDHLNGSFVAMYTHVIEAAQTEGVTHTVLLMSPSSSYQVYSNGDKEPVQGSFPLAVAAETGDTCLVWVSMPMDALSNGLSAGVNFDFAEHAIQWMTDAENASADISGTSIPSNYLSASSTALVLWITVFVFLIPAALITVGAVRIRLRKKR